MKIQDSPLFTSKTDLWSTPQDFFDRLNSIYHFTIDVCALPENAKCAKYYTPIDDGLKQDWSNEIVWCNPPYGRTIGLWIEKAYREYLNGTRIVMLLPARTDTRWFHDYLINQAQIVFIRGRLRFGNATSPAPFPSMLAIFNLDCERPIYVTSLTNQGHHNDQSRTSQRPIEDITTTNQGHQSDQSRTPIRPINDTSPTHQRHQPDSSTTPARPIKDSRPTHQRHQAD